MRIQMFYSKASIQSSIILISWLSFSNLIIVFAYMTWHHQYMYMRVVRFICLHPVVFIKFYHVMLWDLVIDL